jgi:hypothetical protein
VFSIERVGDELTAGEDQLAEWAGEQGESLFLYLVARALAHGDVVVTHEVAAESIHKVKIPSGCIGLGIKCMTPFEMLRKERARFVLGEAS